VSKEQAATQVVGFGRGRVDGESLATGNPKELLGGTDGLEGTLGMDAEAVAGIGVEAKVLGSPEEGEADKEVGPLGGGHGIACGLGGGIDIAQKDVPALLEPSDAGDLRDATQLARGEEHASEAWVGGEGRHATSKVGQFALDPKGSEIAESGAGSGQGARLRGLEPREVSSVAPATRAEEEKRLA
jgi:hypothetical protein